MEIVHNLTALFGGLLALVIVAGGFVMMFAPARARQSLKNAAISLALFVLGTMLLQSFCAGYRR